jgi:hypothetical protein
MSETPVVHAVGAARTIRLIQEEAAARERERIAQRIERLDNTMMNQDELAAYIRACVSSHD